MATYDIKVSVEYNFEVEAENDEDAKKQAWRYEEFYMNAEVLSIEIQEQD